MEMEKTRFPETLKFLMKKKRMTLEDLSVKLGITKQAISAYCTGKNFPNLSTLIRIAEIFNVSMDYLIFGVRPENKIIAEELGLSDNTLDGLKDIARRTYGEKFHGLSYYIDKLLSNEDFLETFYEAITSFEELATYYPIAEDAIKERHGSCNFDSLMSAIENQAAMKITPFFAEFFKEQNIMRGINNQDEYKRLFMKKTDIENIRNELNRRVQSQCE